MWQVKKGRLLEILKSGLVGCDSQVSVALLCVLSGVPVYLYGRPGTGKTLLGRRLLGLIQETLSDSCVSFLDNLVWKQGLELEEIKACMEKEGTKILIGAGLPMQEGFPDFGLQDLLAVRLEMPGLHKNFQLHTLFACPKDSSSSSITQETLTEAEWVELQNAAQKVSLSGGVLAGFRALSDAFMAHNDSITDEHMGWPIFVSPRRWLALARLVRTHAAIEGRAQAEFMDFLVLGAEIWGTRAESQVARVGFEAAIHAFVNERAKGLATWGVRVPLLAVETRRALSASDDLYKTVALNGTDCIEFRVVLGYDHLTLYAPAHYIGTQELFSPWKENGKEEGRLRCNFQGGVTCRILVDSSARQKSYRPSTQTATFEEYGSFTAEVMMKNHGETKVRNVARIEALRKEVKAGLELYAVGLAELKNAVQDKSLIPEGGLVPQEILNQLKDILTARFEQYRSEAQELNTYWKQLNQGNGSPS